MTKYSLDTGRDHNPSRAPAAGTVLPPLQRDGSVCDLYLPGHLIHYKHQGNATQSPALAVSDTFLDGTLVTLQLTDGREIEWRHHDPLRLRRILELLRGRCVAYPEFHALRVGPYWFNCASETDPWQECRLSRADPA